MKIAAFVKKRKQATPIFSSDTDLHGNKLSFPREQFLVDKRVLLDNGQASSPLIDSFAQQPKSLLWKATEIFCWPKQPKSLLWAGCWALLLFWLLGAEGQSPQPSYLMARSRCPLFVPIPHHHHPSNQSFGVAPLAPSAHQGSIITPSSKGVPKNHSETRCRKLVPGPNLVS